MMSEETTRHPAWPIASGICATMTGIGLSRFAYAPLLLRQDVGYRLPLLCLQGYSTRDTPQCCNLLLCVSLDRASLRQCRAVDLVAHALHMRYVA